MGRNWPRLNYGEDGEKTNKSNNLLMILQYTKYLDLIINTRFPEACGNLHKKIPLLTPPTNYRLPRQGRYVVFCYITKYFSAQLIFISNFLVLGDLL